MAETKYYISQVKIPNDTKVYNLKDLEAREILDKLSNATHFLGKTSTALSDGASTATIVIGSDTYAVSPTGTQKQLNNGDIVVASGDAGDSSDEGTEYICAIPGEGTATITWYKFGSAKLNELGSLAYKNTASSSYTPSVTGNKGTLAVASTTIGASDIAVVLSSDKFTGATSFKAVNTSTASKAAVTVTYSKATGGTATVGGDAELTGTIPSIVTGVTGGTGTPNASSSLGLYSVAGGQKIVTDVAANTTGNSWIRSVSVSSVTGGAATVGAATVYGLATSTTKYMTGPESLSPSYINAWTSATATTTANNFTASVNNEILTFNAAAGGVTLTPTTASVLGSATTITAGTSSTATAYTVGKSGATTFTQPTVTLTTSTGGLTVTSNTYKVSVPANTYITSVTAASATIGDVDVTVSGSISATGTVTVTNSSASATGTTDANVITGLTTSTFYGHANVPAHTHSHTLSGDITVTPGAKTVTVS